MLHTIVVPINNEEHNLPTLFGEIDAIRDSLDGEMEVIAVNDGSTDGSAAVLEMLKNDYPFVRVITFTSNFGQSAGFAAGFLHAKGEVVITIDADLQNDPADIPRLLDHYPAYDVVIGVREKRRDSPVRYLSSKIANAVRNYLTDDNITDTGCSLKVFKASIVKQIYPFNGMHRFLPTLCRMHGATVKEVPVNHRERTAGLSHYSIGNRALRALHDAFAVRWMRIRYLRYTIESVDP